MEEEADVFLPDLVVLFGIDRVVDHFKTTRKMIFFHKKLKKYFERTLIDQNKSCLLPFLSVSSYTLTHRKKGFSEKLQEM